MVEKNTCSFRRFPRDVLSISLELQAEIYQGVLQTICAAGVVDWDHFSGSNYSDLTRLGAPER